MWFTLAFYPTHLGPYNMEVDPQCENNSGTCFLFLPTKDAHGTLIESWLDH
jgi:hypothetical protein